MSGDERLFFFTGSGNRRLLGFLHMPAKADSGYALLYCHPFAEEKNLSHSISVKAAREFCAAGIPVFRFDLSGCGDSEGELTDASAEDWIGDLAAAAAVLRRETGLRSLGIWGLRLGCALGVLYGMRDPDVVRYALWQPVTDIKLFLQQFLRQRISSQIAQGGSGQVSVKSTMAEIEAGEDVEVIGYPISRKLLGSLMDQGRGPIPDGVGKPVFLAAINPMEEPGAAMAAAEAGLRGKGVPVHFVHVREPGFWDQFWRWESPLLIRETAAWLKAAP